MDGAQTATAWSPDLADWSPAVVAWDALEDAWSASEVAGGLDSLTFSVAPDRFRQLSTLSE